MLTSKPGYVVYTRTLLFGPLAIILYFGLLPIYSVPQQTLLISFNGAGQAIVSEAAPASVVTGPPDIDGILPGDWLMAINDVPLTPSDLYFRFGVFSQSYQYTLQRNETVFVVEIQQTPLPIPERIYAWLPLLVALETWALGALVLVFAPRDNKLARLLSMVALGIALLLIADRSVAVGIPGSRLVFNLLAPIVSAGYLELALLQESKTARGRAVVHAIYMLASVLALLAITDVLFLSPTTPLDRMLRRSLFTINYGIIGLSQIGVPLITLVRARLSIAPRLRRQLTILAIGTGLAVAPVVLLDVLPLALGFESVVGRYPDLLLPLTGLAPATFAYVILRYQYLGLDMFVVRGATLIIGLVLTVAVYGLLTAVIPATPQSIALTAPLAALVAVGIVLSVGWRLRLGVEGVIFGSSQNLEKLYQGLATQLVHNPQMSTLLLTLLDQIAAYIQVRQAALLLYNRQHHLECVRTLRVQTIDPEPIAAQRPTRPMWRQVTPGAPIWRAMVWPFAIIPIQNADKVLGYAVYGEKVDGPFDARERELLANIASASVVVLENVRLVETLREMSRRLMSHSASERMVMASRLHNEPLQRTAAITLSLEQLVQNTSPESPLATAMGRQIQELRQLKAEIREICSGLRPRVLDEGLSLMLSGVIQTFSEDTPHIQVNFQAATDDVVLSPQAVEAVYHVTLESLNNIRKHSNADCVDISAVRQGNKFVLQITDNGRGLGLATIDLNSLVKEQHLGLAFLYEWAEIALGHLEICDGPTGGTAIRLMLPLGDSSLAHPTAVASHQSEHPIS